MKNNYNSNNIKQDNFLAEVVKYANIIFEKGTELQKNEALDLLFELMEDAQESNMKSNNIIRFPGKY